MGTKSNISEDRRVAIARGWASSGRTQEEYATLHGIRPRTLRQCLRKFGTPRNPHERALEIVENAIADLMAIRAAIHAEQARHAADDTREVVAPSMPVAAPTCNAARLPADDPAPATTGPPKENIQVIRRGIRDSFNDADDTDPDRPTLEQRATDVGHSIPGTGGFNS